MILCDDGTDNSYCIYSKYNVFDFSIHVLYCNILCYIVIYYTRMYCVAT